MRQRKRVLAFLLAMAMLLGGWTSAGVRAGAAGEILPESRAVETAAAEETGAKQETESVGETEPAAETKETGPEKQTDPAEETESGSESTEETETAEETVPPEESTEETSPAETGESGSIEEAGSAGETENAEETGSTEETAGAEETGVSEEEAALYGAQVPSIVYDVHMQTYGWVMGGKDGSSCGKEDAGKRLEALRMQISGVEDVEGLKDLGVEYQVYSAGKGWVSGSNGSTAGTIGERRRVEALKASLTGAAAGQYDIYYRVYIQEYGWLHWAKNGGNAGVASSWNRTVEAVQVKVQAKGDPAPGATAKPYLETDPDEGYPNTHVNTGDRVTDIIAVAKTQVGYYKKEDTPTKFGSWYNVYSNAGGDYFPSAPWCAMFASWCAKQANIPASIFRMHSGTRNMVEWYKKDTNPGYWHDKGDYTPQPGDLIFFQNSQNSNYVNHVGIVTEVSGGKVYSIEGNTTYDAAKDLYGVMERSYKLDNARIVGYATPDYNETGVTAPPPEKMQIAYRADVEGKEWEPWVGDGEKAGTTGSYKMLRALMIRLSGNELSGGVSYRTHMQTQGWQDWVSDGAISGIPGGTKRMEAVQIKLTGEAEKQYDIYYRAHCQSFGWLDWAKNGESAGSEGYAKRVEAIEVRLVPKGSAAPGKTEQPFRKKGATVTYSTHCQTYGWLEASENGVMNGTTGKYKRLEGIRISLERLSGEVTYRTHVQTYGWQGWVKNGAVSGTTGQAKRLEAIEIKLSGAAASQYDIYYRVHSQTYGWMGWAKNGEPAGTSGLYKRLEAIEIRLVPKGGAAPGTTEGHYVKN